MKISPLQIQDLENIQDLSREDLSPVQGGGVLAISSVRVSMGDFSNGAKPLTEVNTELNTERISLRFKRMERIAYPHPIPAPCNPFPSRPICTNFPTKDGHLPWCAVIL